MTKQKSEYDWGYKAYIISTVVDEKVTSPKVYTGYKAYIISTVGDRLTDFRTANGAIMPI